MQTEAITIKSKGDVLETSKYEYPESLEEAIKVDGPEKIFAYYGQQRKIRYMDGRRRALTGGGVTSAMAKALKSATPEKLLEIAKKLGDEDLTAAVKAMGSGK